MDKIVIYIDGASKGNPGKASTGIVIQDSGGTTLKECGDSIGNATCNVAEYLALITALIEGFAFKCSDIEIRSDSLLLVRQMLGTYKVKNEWLKQLKLIAERLSGQYAKVTFTHIPREKNKQADKIANSYIENTLL